MKIAYLITILIVTSQSLLLSVNSNYTISYKVSHDELAHAYYDQKLNSEGSNYFYSYANRIQPLIDQHRGSGFLQGYTTYQEIRSAYINFNKFKINGASVTPKLQEYLNNQMEFIQTMAQKFPRDIYWQYAFAYLQQCRYAYRGFLQRINEEDRLDLYIGFSQYYYLTNIGDLGALLPAFDPSQEGPQKSCTGFIKKTEDDIYVSHSTGNSYPYMLRVVKSYHFPSRDTSTGSETITFSSRPGDLSSKDSYYILSSGLKVIETSFLNYNKDNYKELNPRALPSWIRVNVASRMAKDGQQWVDYYAKYNSGTHSGQWIVVDKQKIGSSRGLILFLEQAFSMIRVSDMTERLQSQGYIGTFNVPYNQQIYDKLAYQQYQFDYQNAPSARILKQINPIVNNQQDIKTQMLTNNQTKPGDGIAPRRDLDSSPFPYGLIDCKVSSSKTDALNFFWMISSPTTSQGRFKPFTWKTFPNISHEGMPTEYNFDWVKVPINYEKSLNSKKVQNLQEE